MWVYYCKIPWCNSCCRYTPIPNTHGAKAWLSKTVINPMLEKQKLRYLSHQSQSDQWCRDRVLVYESDWLESIIQTGEKEIVLSFGLDSSHSRQAPEGYVPVCRILTAGSTPTAVTGGAEKCVLVRYNLTRYLIWVKETVQCLFLRDVPSNLLPGWVAMACSIFKQSSS